MHLGLQNRIRRRRVEIEMRQTGRGIRHYRLRIRLERHAASGCGRRDHRQPLNQHLHRRQPHDRRFRKDSGKFRRRRNRGQHPENHENRLRDQLRERVFVPRDEGEFVLRRRFHARQRRKGLPFPDFREYGPSELRKRLGENRHVLVRFAKPASTNDRLLPSAALRQSRILELVEKSRLFLAPYGKILPITPFFYLFETMC